MENQPVHKTYHKGRKCLHCAKPIADSEHGLTKFCERHVLPDGSVQSCKDDYHTAQNRKLTTLCRSIALHHKHTLHQIEKLLADKGTTVSLEQLVSYDINLFMPWALKVDENRHYNFYFIKYAIKPLTNNQYKIFTHEFRFK